VSSVAERKLMEELMQLLNKPVTVVTTGGKTYTGILAGADADALNICLTDARDDTGASMHKPLLNGQTVAQIFTTGKPFDLSALAERLERVFPKMVNHVAEANTIVVMGRVRVGEKGLIEGSGPAAERVQRIYEEFVREWKGG